MKKIISIIITISILFASVPAFAISGTGTESNPYLISSASDIDKIHNDLDGYYKLTADINMSGIVFEPIGNEWEGPFSGTIDGNGYTISNLDINLPGNKYVGFIGYLEGTVKNLNINNVDSCGYRYVSGLIGYAANGSIISNCSVSGALTCEYEFDTPYVGGIVGDNNAVIDTCTNLVNITIPLSFTSYVGGIAGKSTACITNSVNKAQIDVSSASANVYVGGIAGYTTAEIENSVNHGKLDLFSNYNSSKFEIFQGGITGLSASSIENCKNYNSVTITTETQYYTGNAGGIAGGIDGNIYNCLNFSNIIAKNYSGGIAGLVYSNSEISYCQNNGSISSYYAGGITGSCSDLSTVDFCINNGVIEGYYAAGGISGRTGFGANVTVSHCANNAKIVSKHIGYSSGSGSISYAGGIIGDGSHLNINNCINSGMIIAFNSNTASSGSSYAYAAGIVPASSYVNCENNISIGNSAASIDAIKGNSYVGGISLTGSQIINCYQLMDTKSTTENGVMLSESEFKEIDKFQLFDFEEAWEIDETINNGFPLLRGLPEHIELSNCVKVFEVGYSDRLYAYKNGVNENVTWSSDNELIATVSNNGTVYAKDIGSCMITATNAEGMKANCLIYVYEKGSELNLSPNYHTMEIGSQYKIDYMLTPSTSNEAVVWSSNNEDVVSVAQDGTVSAKSKGSAVITATTVKGKIKATCEIITIGKPITNIYCSTTSKTMNVDETFVLPLTITPTEYSGELTWNSTNRAIVDVNENGIITAKAPGTAVISVTADTGKSTYCTITVKAPATEIKLNKSELTLQKGYTEKLLPAMMPEYTTDSISWASSNSSYVSVSTDGTVTAKAVGQVIITATTTSGQKAYCTVNVVNPSVPVSSVTLDKTELIMTKADMAQLKASVLPTNATNQNLTWVSSDESVATVNSTGVVTAVDTGVVIISATANNGVYHECVIKVISASGSSVILSDVKASPDGTVQVKASIVKNPGISGYKFTVNYDETLLTPVAVTPNSEFGGSITTNLDDDNRVGLNIVWYANEDIDINGELFTIDFKVSDSAEYGDTSSVSIEYGAKDICNTAGEYFALYIDDATISIEEPIPGDIYEDGEVVVYDLTVLSRYITSLETFTERQKEAADVNNDDLVNVLDVIKMAQYLTGWSGVQLMSLDLFSVDEPAAPVISVGSASVNAANEAEIPVYIKGNTGIAAYKFILDYNANDIEILSITPSELINKDFFNHNLGAESQAEDGLIVTSRTSGGNMTEDGVLFTIKVRYKNPTDTSVSPISIRDIFDNMGNEDGNYVTATYETGYALGRDYIVANKVVGDTNFSCELYFDDSYAEQSAKAIIAFYDGDGRMVQLMPKDITVKPGKVDLSIDYDKKVYATYKLMIWEGLNSLKPITEVK